MNDFWREKIGHYVMQGDYLALIMEEGGRHYLEEFFVGYPTRGS